VTLHDDGTHGDDVALDGIAYGALRADAIEDPGSYHVGVECTGAIGARTLVRSGRSVFVATSDAVRVTGPATLSTGDRDGDSLIDYVRCSYSCDVSTPGVYTLRGELVDSVGETIASYVKRTTVVSPGPGVVVLEFDAASIVMHGREGPWSVTNVSISSDAPDYAVLCRPTNSEPITRALSELEPPPPPTLRDVSHDVGSPSGGEEVRLVGTALFDVVTVHVGRVSARFREDHPDVLHVSIPRDLEGPPYPRSVPIVVTTKWGKAELATKFKYAH